MESAHMTGMETRTDPKSRFTADTAHHQMTVLLDQGLHRHLRFANPASRVSWFEIITVPGLLTINGDMGTYTFAREHDMFAFFRRTDGGINDHYWTEKLLAGDAPAKEYSSKVFIETVRQDAEDQLDDAEADAGQRAAALAALTEEVLTVASEYGEREAVEALDGFNHELLDFTDAWEHDFTAYSLRYLWNLHAIVHGINQYRALADNEAESPAKAA